MTALLRLLLAPLSLPSWIGCRASDALARLVQAAIDAIHRLHPRRKRDAAARVEEPSPWHG